jgi:CRISPR/Cas system CSM-associated protein Csm4 (group 5 of RAMP superfamily)
MYSIAKPYCISSCSLYSAIASTFRLLYIYISLFTNAFYNKNIYLTSLFLVNSLLILYFAKYNLNHLSIYPVRNNFI